MVLVDIFVKICFNAINAIATGYLHVKRAHSRAAYCTFCVMRQRHWHEHLSLQVRVRARNDIVAVHFFAN